jgi:hypothetical protein
MAWTGRGNPSSTVRQNAWETAIVYKPRRQRQYIAQAFYLLNQSRFYLDSAEITACFD